MTQESKEYKINNPEAKEQVEAKAEHLDNVLEQGNQIEKETQGENPNWKEVKDLHAGTAPIDKVLFEDKKAPVEEVKEVPKEPEKKQPETPKEEKAPETPQPQPTPPQPEIKKDEPEITPPPQSKPEPASKKEDKGDGEYKGYTHRI